MKQKIKEDWLLCVKNRAENNLVKWGLQDINILGLACGEELGEMCQAILQNEFEGGDASRIVSEAIDLGALCLQILAVVEKSHGENPLKREILAVKEGKI